MAARQSLSNGAGAQQEDESSEGDSLPSPNPGTHAQSIFPLDSYRQAYLELHQASWVIQFPLVTECIEATEEILGGVSRFVFLRVESFLLVCESACEVKSRTCILLAAASHS